MHDDVVRQASTTHRYSECGIADEDECCLNVSGGVWWGEDRSFNNVRGFNDICSRRKGICKLLRVVHMRIARMGGPRTIMYDFRTAPKWLICVFQGPYVFITAARGP